MMTSTRVVLSRRFAFGIVSAVLIVAFVTPLPGQTSINLSPLTAPGSGQAGVTNVVLTGSNFPSGTILPASVTVTLEAATPGAGPTASTVAIAIATVVGTTRRVTFRVPSEIAVTTPTAYRVRLSGATSSGVKFASSNAASLTVNPPAAIASIGPQTGKAGSTIDVTIAGQFTNFVQGSTQASFGPGIAVGAAAEGGFGTVTVTGSTTAVARVSVNASAAGGTRTIVVRTGIQQASLVDGFTVTTPRLTSVFPGTGQQGQTLSISIEGEHTGFVQGQSQVTFGAGITVNSVTVATATMLTANVTIGAAAPVGLAPVSVSTGTETVSLPNAFEVTAAPPPPPPPPPSLSLTITEPVDGAVLSQSLVTVRGTVSDPEARVVVQNVIAAVLGTTFEARGVLLSAGRNDLLTRAVTTAGLQASATRTVTLDGNPPALTVFSPPDRSIFTAATATVSGTVSDATPLTCAIAGDTVAVDNGVFSRMVPLANGRNEIGVMCRDAAQNTSSRLLTLFRDSEPLVTKAVEPPDGAADVNVSAPVEIHFSEPVDRTSVTTSTVLARAGDTILPVGVTVSADGMSVTVTPLVPFPPGTTIVITVTGGVRDAAGNPIAIPSITEFTTAGTPISPGVISGEVYDDGRSLPLAQALVEALDKSTRQVLAATETDDRGRYLLDPGRNDVLLRITKSGYTTVERATFIDRGSFVEALDARLTPRTESRLIRAVLGGEVASATGDVVTIPAGAFEIDRNVSLTAISAQGPIASFPAGWTPLTVVDLQGPESTILDGRLKLHDRTNTAGGRPAIVARYDVVSASWVTIATVVVPAGSDVELSMPIGAGQFALLIPDDGEGGPVEAAIGQPLPPGAPGAIPSDANASGAVNPPVGRADDPTPALATIDITSPTALRSGTLLRGDFMEAMMLRSGGQAAPFDTSQDFVGYRSLQDVAGRTLAASFPIAPSRVFGPSEVIEGSITVRLSRGLLSGRSIVGIGGGGVSSSDGSRVVVPSGALTGNVPVGLLRLDAATFPMATPSNLTFLGGLELDLANAVAGSSLTLSLSGSGSAVPSGARVVVGEIRNVKGLERLVLVAVARIDGSDLTTESQIEGVPLPGVRQTGRYGFYRFDGPLAPVSGTARDDAGRRDGHVTELAAMPFVALTDAAGGFVLVSQPGAFNLIATAAANGDQARVSGTTGTALADVVIGATPPRVEEITVRLARLEGEFAGPVSLLGKPAPIVDDDSMGDSAGNSNGAIDPGERIELTLSVRNDGTVPLQGGFFVLGLRGPPGPISVQPANIPLGFLPPDEPLAVGPFVFTVPAGVDPARLRFTLAYANSGGLANAIPFSLPLGVEHPNVPPASDITVRFSEPVVRTSLTGAVSLSLEEESTLTPVDVALVVASDDRSLIIRPLAPLADNVVYRITLTSQVIDLDKRPLANAPYVERFRTEDRTPPPVVPPGQIEASVPDADGFVTVTGSPGSVNPDDIVIGLNATTGFSVLATVNADGSFVVRVRADVTDEVSILVRDSNGNTTTLDAGPFLRRDPVTGVVLGAVVGRAGGTVSTETGVRLIVPAGAVHRGTELSAARMSETFQLPADIRANAAVAGTFNALFTVVERIRITASTAAFTGPIRLSVPVPEGADADDQFVVWRSRTVTFGGPLADIDRRTGVPLANNPIVTAERLQIVETATVKTEGGQPVLSTDSPPFPGITEPGEYTIARVNSSLTFLAGEVRRDTTTGPVVPRVIVRSLPDALPTSPFAALTDSQGRFVVADGSLTGPFAAGAVVTSRLDAFDHQFTRVIRRDVRGTVGPPAPRRTVVAHLEEAFVLPTRLPPEITEDIGDLEPPIVELLIEGPTYDDGFSTVGSPLKLTVNASDNDELVFIGLELDEGAGFLPVALLPDHTFELTPSAPGLLVFRAQARDRSGNVTFADNWVVVLAPGQGINPIPRISLAPVRGRRGQTLSVSIVGRHTHFEPGVSQITFEDGITVASPVVVNATSITVQVTIDSAARLGPRTVTVTGNETVRKLNGFTVTDTTSPSISLVPDGGYQGETLTVTVLGHDFGQDTSFVQGLSQVSFGGGIAAGAPAVTTSTALTVQLSIDIDAAVGPRMVFASTTGPQPHFAYFTVLAVPPPRVFCGAFDGTVDVQFWTPLDAATISPQSVRLLDPEGNPVPATRNLGRNGSRIVILPDRYLRLGATYRVVLTDALRDTAGNVLHAGTLSCLVRAPQPTLISDAVPADQSSAALTLSNVTDVALVGDTLLVINHPDGSAPGDDGSLHALKITFNDTGGVDATEFDAVEDEWKGGAETLNTTRLAGRPLSLATNGTRAFVANRFLGTMTLGQPFIGTAVLGLPPNPAFPLEPLVPGVDLVLGCSGVDLQVGLLIGFDPTVTCTTLKQFWNYPQPASNLSVLDLSNPRDPQRVGGIALNAIPPGLWNPQTWPDRVEVETRVDTTTGMLVPHRLGIQSFATNLEFLSLELTEPVGPTLAPKRLGIVGQISDPHHIDPNRPQPAHLGRDGKPWTADDDDNEFYDAAFFPKPLHDPTSPIAGFAVTLVRDGVRIMQTEPLLPGEQNSKEIQFLPMAGTYGGRVGSVPHFQWGGDEGVEFTSHLAFVGTTDNTLHIFDVTNPASPDPLATLTGAFGTVSFDACRGLAYVQGRNGAINVIDFNNPSAPRELNLPDPDPLGTVVPFRFDGLAPHLTFNGNVNRDGVVYVASENGVGAFRMPVSSSVRYPKRLACGLRVTPNQSAVPIGTVQGLVATGGVGPYTFTLASTASPAILTDNHNGSASIISPRPASIDVKVTDGIGNSVNASLHFFLDLKIINDFTGEEVAKYTPGASSPSGTISVAVGQRIRLRATSSLTADSHEWIINGTPKRDYKIDVDKGEVIDLTNDNLDDATVSFVFFGTENSADITYAYTIAGNIFPITIHADIAQPTVVKFEASLLERPNIVQSPWFLASCDTQPVRRPGSYYKLVDYLDKAGVEWTATVLAPAGHGDGTIAFFQRLMVTIEVAFDDNSRHVASSNGRFVLDGDRDRGVEYPDPEGACAFSVRIAPGGIGTLVSHDSPSVPLEPSLRPPAHTNSVSVDQSDFELFLMYLANPARGCRPDNNGGDSCVVWVPLRYLPWNWGGMVSSNPDGSWPVIQLTSPGTRRMIQGETPTRLPNWDGHAQRIQLVPR